VGLDHLKLRGDVRGKTTEGFVQYVRKIIAHASGCQAFGQAAFGQAFKSAARSNAGAFGGCAECIT
jgi:hypothetical protein